MVITPFSPYLKEMENTTPTPNTTESIKDFQQVINSMASNAERIKAITEALLSLYNK